MDTNTHEHAEAHLGGSCAKPELRERLSIYILNPLEDPSAEEVEDHLLDCLECREQLMSMLRLRSAMRRTKKSDRNELENELDDAEVFSLTEFS
jgi:anti-sigma factor RsiW